EQRRARDRGGDDLDEREQARDDHDGTDRDDRPAGVPQRAGAASVERARHARVRAHVSPPSVRSIRRSTYCEPMLRPSTVTKRTTPAANSALICEPLAMPYWLAMRLVSVSVL